MFDSVRSFLDATYFVFISITTIGLGDYIPGDSTGHMEYRDVYKTVVGLFLLFGLVLTSLTLTIFYDIPQVSKCIKVENMKIMIPHNAWPSQVS